MKRRLVSGVLCVLGLGPISWTSKRQGTIKTSRDFTEFCAGRVATEEAFALRYMLRSLGVTVKCATALCGDNLGMIISCTNPGSDLKKKHVALLYHDLRESVAAVIFNPLKVCIAVNQADILNKGVSAGKLIWS